MAIYHICRVRHTDRLKRFRHFAFFVVISLINEDRKMIEIRTGINALKTFYHNRIDVRYFQEFLLD